MQTKDIILGIDTSNYKTSIALVGLEGQVYADKRILLKVKKGERGLRQSEALFQHVNNLPELTKDCFNESYNIKAIAVSTRPRPVEGSYMPCFNAGYGLARSLAATHNVPLFETSHQEGHIAAIESKLDAILPEEFLALHLSGGTCELLRVKKHHPGYSIEIIGGSKDISFGQVLDRVGVALNYPFPSGEYLDREAMTKKCETNLLKGITVKNCYFNLSGIETQALNNLDKKIIPELFLRLTTCLEKLADQAVESTGIKDLVFAGGVSSSRYISTKLTEYAKEKGYKFHFGSGALSTDNAIGVAMIGKEKYESNHSFTTE